MRYVTTQTGFYTDPDLEHWSVQAMWLYRYLYENDHAHGISGTGRISKAVMLAETRLTPTEFTAAKHIIGDKVKWYPDGTYWVVGRIKHTCYKNDGNPSPKHVDGLANRLQGLSAEIRRDVIARYPIDTLLIRYPGLLTVAVAVTETEAEIETESVAVEPAPLEIDNEPSRQQPAVSAPAPCSATALAGQFMRHVKQGTGENFVVKDMVGMLAIFTEAQVSAAIELCAVGDTTKVLNNRLNGSGDGQKPKPFFGDPAE